MRLRHQTRRAALAGALLAVTALGAAGCGTSRYSRRLEEDGRLSALATRSLAEARVTGVGLEARSHDGVVALLGHVSRPADRDRAEKAVAGIAGVVRVNNLILVEEELSASTAAPASRGAPLNARAD